MGRAAASGGTRPVRCPRPWPLSGRRGPTSGAAGAAGRDAPATAGTGARPHYGHRPRPAGRRCAARLHPCPLRVPLQRAAEPGWVRSRGGVGGPRRPPDHGQTAAVCGQPGGHRILLRMGRSRRRRRCELWSPPSSRRVFHRAAWSTCPSTTSIAADSMGRPTPLAAPLQSWWAAARRWRSWREATRRGDATRGAAPAAARAGPSIVLLLSMTAGAAADRVGHSRGSSHALSRRVLLVHDLEGQRRVVKVGAAARSAAARACVSPPCRTPAVVAAAAVAAAAAAARLAGVMECRSAPWRCARQSPHHSYSAA